MQRDKLDFRNEKISRLFSLMFFPTLVGMLFNSLLNICDGMFVGHGVGSDGLAAINIVAPVFLLCTGVGLMFGIGASVICGLRMAEGNVKAARIIATQSVITGLVIFAVVIGLCLLFSRPLLSILGCSAALETYATDYLMWLLPGLVFLYLQCVGMMLIRQDGAPKYAMAVQIISAVLNIFLDWLMVFPLNWGLKGAAIATSISCGIGGILVLVYLFFGARTLRIYRLKFTVKSMKLTLRNIGYMSHIGLATLIAELSMGIMMVAGNYMFGEYLGDAGVAAFSIGCYLFPIIFSINNAVAQAAQPIISYNYGAGMMTRVRQTLHTSLFASFVCGVLVTLCLYCFAQLLAAVFLSPDVPAYALAVKGLPLLGICAVFFAMNITFIGYYQSCEKAGRSIIFMLLRGVVFLVPLFVLLPCVWGVNGLWLAIPMSEILTLIVIVLSYFFNNRPRRISSAA